MERAVQWLRRHYGCHIVLSEQACCTGETPDVIGWKKANRSVLVECKISRADFLADAKKPWRSDPAGALGCERYYLAPAGLIRPEELAAGWGLLEARGREVEIAVRCSPRKSLRSPQGLMNELNLLLASLRRVEIRIEPQSITEFLKWENRMARYNGGQMPEGVEDPNKRNSYLN
ncbi:MAG TPA: hypothetical protein VFU76_05570 [Terriglobales bacterium]|nr:hypothetical protein [Terriglobales bacterium]